MDRFLMEDLIAWKDSSRRKPLILNGARQVGKTWLLKEFGRTQFRNVAYVSLDNNPGMVAQFEAGYDIPRIIVMLQAQTGERIVPGETLIILDEIQECPEALTSLKYFCEDAPEYAVAAAGSLLGITLHRGTGYPVGKVNSLDLHPLSFREFLDAMGECLLREALDMGDATLLDGLASKLEPLLRQYYYVGGMPEAVRVFAANRSFQDARTVQGEILQSYERDMTKHMTLREAERVLAAWHSVPVHLGQENKKFVFGHIADGARARDYRPAITWLAQSGIATKVPRVSRPGIPLAAYADEQAFKLFLVDVGLLCAMTQVDVGSIVDGNRIFEEFKGALTEQYVCQQLVSDCGLVPYCWSAENSRGEVDFLVQSEGRTYPIEVKAEENVRARSLRTFSEKYEGLTPRRFSMSGFRDQDWMRNVPLYAVGATRAWM